MMMTMRCRVLLHYVIRRSMSAKSRRPDITFDNRLNFINGKRCTPSGSDITPVFYPATYETLCELRESTQGDIDEAVDGAVRGQIEWAKRSAFERGKTLTKAAHLLRSKVDHLVDIETLDAGKPRHECQWDVDACADYLEYVAGSVSIMTRGHRTRLSSDGSHVFTTRDPIGVCLGIGAWNYPFQMAMFKAAPCLACGNSMIFKPSPLTPLNALEIAETFVEAGVPSGVFQVVQGGAKEGSALLDHPAVAKVSFTGSVAAGTRVYESAARQMKKATMELGGKSSLIVFDDVADLDSTVTGAMMANFFSQGQVCSNASRVYVHRKLFDQFHERLVTRTKLLSIGDPFDVKTRVGATICREHADRVQAFVDEAVERGDGKLSCGGERVTVEGFENGNFLAPAVFADVKKTSSIFNDEIFGAVCMLIPFDDEDEAVSCANAMDLGLAGGVFSGDGQRANRVAERLAVGTVYINTFNALPVEMSFGGWKKSGIGRECGPEAFEFWTKTKGVYVEGNTPIDDPFS